MCDEESVTCELVFPFDELWHQRISSIRTTRFYSVIKLRNCIFAVVQSCFIMMGNGLAGEYRKAFSYVCLCLHVSASVSLCVCMSVWKWLVFCIICAHADEKNADECGENEFPMPPFLLKMTHPLLRKLWALTTIAYSSIFFWILKAKTEVSTACECCNKWNRNFPARAA